MRSHLVFVLASSLAIATTMCSSEDSGSSGTVTPEGAAAGRYRGVVNGGGDTSGVIDLTLTASGGTNTQSVRPLAGTATSYTLRGSLNLNLPGIGPVALTGTLDLATNTATFSGTFNGGAVPFTGTYANGVITGEATFPAPIGRAPFTISNERLGALRTYCGSFAGGLAGRWSILTAGTRAGLVYATSDGVVGGGEGTIDFALFSAQLRGGGTATGAYSAGAQQISGSWTIGTAMGSFATSESACAALTPPGTTPDGGPGGGGPGDGGPGDGGPGDGGPDGGPAGTPELVYTAASTFKITNLTLTGNKIFYALGVPFNLRKITISSVGTDGSAPTVVVPDTDQYDEVMGMTSTAARIYWISGGFSNDTRLLSVPVTGGAPTDHARAGDISTPDSTRGASRITNDGTSIFTATAGSQTHQIQSYGLDGAILSTLTGVTGPTGISVDGTDVLLGTFEGLYRAPKTLANIGTQLTPRNDYGQFSYIPITLSDADNIYFISNELNGSAVWRRPKAGGPIVAIVPLTPQQFRGLALMDGYLYFHTRVTGGPTIYNANLVRVPKNGTNVMLPSSIGPSNPFDIVTDGTYVYYADDKSIRRIHK